jgi:hypothetical protein
MRNKCCKVAALIVLTASIFARAAAEESSVTEDDFEIVQNAGGGITITGYTGNAKDVAIPATISGLPVTAIGESAFEKCKLTGITIPDGVTTIGEHAFISRVDLVWSGKSGNNFPELVIPDSVATIGDHAFAACGIQSLTLGSGLQSIETNAFAYNAFEDLSIPASVLSIGGGAFRDCGIKTLTLAEGLRYIGISAFINNAIESLTVPDSVTHIEGGKLMMTDGAFQNCNITSLTLGKGLTSIGDNTFADNKITELSLPDSLKSIGYRAFRNNQLTEVVIPEGVVYVSTAFGGNPLAGITIPPSLATALHKNSIGQSYTGFADSFEGLPITRITLPEEVFESNLWQFGESFVNFWKLQTEKAGTYVYTGRIWRLE